MIKAIVFDYGGVLGNRGGFWPFSEKYAKEFNTTPEELHNIIKKYWKLARIEKISSTEFWEGVARELKCDKDYFKLLMKNFPIINIKVLEFVKSLKKKYKLALLSNHIRDWLEEIIRENNFNQIFEVIVTSYESCIEKPNIPIYEETLEKLGLKPEECVFIDDKEKNLPPAEELGINVILFKDIDQLKKELKELDIDF